MSLQFRKTNKNKHLDNVVLCSVPNLKVFGIAPSFVLL